jgi:molybdopterin-guanine dinucleotide biosynthesis protein A
MLVDLGGRSIGSLLLGELVPAFSHAYISVKNEEQARMLVGAGIHVPETASFVDDLTRFPGGSRDDAAIFGLYSALLAVKEPYALVTSGDMPFVNLDIAGLLANHLLDDPGAVVPRWANGYMEPTLAIYKVAPAALRIKDMLINKQYQLVELVRGLKNVVHVPVDELQQLDPSLACLVNVNTERDLEHARQLYKERSGKK